MILKYFSNHILNCGHSSADLLTMKQRKSPDTGQNYIHFCSQIRITRDHSEEPFKWYYFPEYVNPFFQLQYKLTKLKPCFDKWAMLPNYLTTQSEPNWPMLCIMFWNKIVAKIRPRCLQIDHKNHIVRWSVPRIKHTYKEWFVLIRRTGQRTGIFCP